jgi:hypothetical protein
MNQSSTPADRYEPESLYSGITRWAAHASRPMLAFLVAAGLPGAAAILLLDWRRWPFAAILFTAATVGAWGLAEQRAPHPHSAPVRLAESLLTLLGMLLAAGAALGFFFGFLGPAPIL